MIYDVSIVETPHWYEVEADSEEEAEKKAWELYEMGKGGYVEVEAKIGTIRQIKE